VKTELLYNCTPVVVTVVMVVVIMLVIRDGVFPTLLVLILLVCAGAVLCTQNDETKKTLC
jgi:uncharacterized membrane protein